MEITKGKIARPVRALMCGVEGVGKSTFASKFPNPLFIDCEDGTRHLDVARTPRPTSWSMLKAIVEDLTKDAKGFKTLVIDTADWADRLAVADVCSRVEKIKSIEDYGYGKGYVMLAEEWGRLLDLLSNLQDKQNMNVLFLCHSTLKHVELPDEIGSFDRYEPKLEKKSSSLIREWADLMLFANFKVMVVEQDNKKRKAQGGSRVMYAQHHPCWDAKNRYDLPEEMPLDVKNIAGVFQTAPTVTAPKTETKVEQKSQIAATQEQTTTVATTEPTKPAPVAGLPACLPDKLRDLMSLSGVSVDDLKKVCTKSYPIDTPIENYSTAFWTDKIIPSWDKVLVLITKVKQAA